MMNVNAFTMKKVLVHERTNKRNYHALSVQSQVKLVKLVYIVSWKYTAIQTRTCKVTCSLF